MLIVVNIMQFSLIYTVQFGLKVWYIFKFFLKKGLRPFFKIYYKYNKDTISKVVKAGSKIYEQFIFGLLLNNTHIAL